MKLLQRGTSMDEELLDEIFADLAADLVDLSDDEIKDRILKYGLDPADMKEVYDTVKAVQKAEALGDENLDPLNIDAVDKLADANTKSAKRMANGEPEPLLYQLPADKPVTTVSKTKMATAKDMANEDQTKVKVTEEDKDSDGDTDKITVEKEDPEDDTELTDDERAIINYNMGSHEDTEELDNSSETEDKPHEEPKFKNKTNQFARFLGENRLGGM